MTNIHELYGKNWDKDKIYTLNDMRDLLNDMYSLADGLALLSGVDKHTFGNEIIPFRLGLYSIANQSEKCIHFLDREIKKTHKTQKNIQRKNPKHKK